MLTPPAQFKVTWLILVSLLMAVIIPAALYGIRTSKAATVIQRNPSANAAENTSGDGFEVSPDNAYTDGAGDAQNLDGSGDRHIYFKYGFDSVIPTDASIEGIEVRLDWYVDSSDGESSMSAEISWDGGSNWSSPFTDNAATTAEHTAILGGSTDNWGHSWTPSELTDNNFRVRVTSVSDNAERDFYLDWIPVSVHFATVDHLEVTGSTGMVAGESNQLTITAVDTSGNTAINYSGTKSLTFSGPTAAPGGQVPTIGGAEIGESVSIDFAGGVSVNGSATLVAFKAETATVDVTDGAVGSSGDQAYDLDLTVNAANAARLDLTPDEGETIAGQPFSITVTAYDQYGNVATSYTGMVHFTSTDSGTGVALPGDYTFTSGDSGIHAFSGVTLLAAGSQDVTVTDTLDGALTDTGTWTVAAAVAVRLDLTPDGGNATAGAPFSVTVTAYDGHGNVATGYTGTIHFISTDSGTGVAMPGGYTFTTSDNGTHAFSGVILVTVGSRDVTVTDTADAALIDTETWTVAADNAARLEVKGDSTMTAGAANELTIIAKDAYGNVATSYGGAKTLSFSGPLTSSGGYWPRIEGTDLLTGTITANFSNGVSAAGGATLEAFRAESVSVDVSDGSINSFGDPEYDLDLTVNPAGLDSYVVDSSTYTQVAGVDFDVGVTANDIYGNVVTTDNSTIVTLTSSSATLFFDGNSNVVYGETGDNVKTLTNGGLIIKARDTIAASGVTITAKDSNSKTGTSLPYTINPGSIDHYELTSSSYTQIAGLPFELSVTAYDAYNNKVVADSSTTVALTSNSASLLFNGNGDGFFGAPGDNVKTLSTGAFAIQARDAVAGSGVIIIATDGNLKTGNSSAFTINPLGKVVSSDGWAWQNPWPQGNTLRSIWASSTTDVFAVGDTGMVLHNDGATWASMESSTTNDLHGVWGSSPSNVFAVGAGGVILHYNGSNWTSMAGGTANDLYSIWGSSPSNVFAVGAGGVILRYNGSGWTSMNSGVTVDLYGIWNDGVEAYAVGSSGVILHYNGTSWTSVTSGTTNRLMGVWGEHSSDIFAVGESGTILHYGGTGWASQPSGTTNGLQGVFGTFADQVLAVGEGGVVLYYDGMHWHHIQSSMAGDLYAVSGSSSNNMLVVGERGVILRCDGQAVSAGSFGIQTTLYAIWGTDPSNVFGAGYAGAIYRYDGVGWMPMNSGTPNSIYDLWGTSASDVFAVGAAGTILHFDGTIWSAMNSGTGQTFQGVWGRSPSDVYAVGLGGIVLHYDGVKWTSMDSGITSGLYDIWGNASDVFAVGDAGTIIRRDGTGWTKMGSGTASGLWAIWGSSASDIFAAGTMGTVLHYDGTNWTRINSGTDWFQDIWGSSASSVFAVANTGRIWYYDGTTWTTLNTGTTNDLWAIWGSSANDVFAVGNSGTVLHYPDQDPPTVTSINTSSVGLGATVDVIVTGTNFNGTLGVSFGPGITVDRFTVDSPSQITARITVAVDAVLGPRDVYVTTPSGTGKLEAAFAVVVPPSPTITKVSPDHASAGDTLSVVISGTNLTAAQALDFGPGIKVVSFSVDSPTSMTVLLTVDTNAALGARDVSVTTPGGTGKFTSAFTVVMPSPTVEVASPDNGQQGLSLYVIITGTGFTDITALDFGQGIIVDEFSVESPTRITAAITIDPKAVPGPRDVLVASARGTGRLVNGFTIMLAAPIVDSIDPGQGQQGRRVSVVITGTNLTGVSTLDFGPGITVKGFTVLNSAQIEVNLAIERKASLGPRSVTVTGPGGTSSFNNIFMVTAAQGSPTNIPVIVAVAALSILTGGLVIYVLKRR